VTTLLHLGVNDVPYSIGKGKTTGDVAEILEHKYHIMATFAQIYDRQIREAATKSIQGAVSTMIIRGVGSTKRHPLAGATGEIEHLFKQALSQRAFDGKITGVPTLAALRGVSHRFKRPYARRPARPSFIDTGLYQSSFRAWVD
jgi:hypothetical protein